MVPDELGKLGNYEFEALIANMTKKMGYTVEMIPLGQDLGIDIIARKGSESLAIQVKKYENRKVNLDIIYHTYGACSYYDCTRAIVATLGTLTPNAEKAANKLNVDIWNSTFIKTQLGQVQPNNLPQINKDREHFYQLWDNHFKTLEGRRIKHLTKDTYILIRTVDEDGICEISSNNKERFFPIYIFKWAVAELSNKGNITRSDINDEYKKRGSSAISAILSTLPNVSIDFSKRPIALTWK